MESLGRWLVTRWWSQEEREATAPCLTGVTANALRAFVLDRFGEEGVHRALSERAQVDGAAAWSDWGHVPNDRMVKEDAYLSVVLALTTAFNMELYDFLFEFGQFLLTWMAEKAGYGRSIHRVAPTFPEFCRGLTQFMNQMFDSMGTLKNMMPHISVREDVGDSFTLLLFGSELPDRPPVLLGLLERIAGLVFDVRITFERLPNPSRGCQAMHIRMSSSTTPPRPLPRCQHRSSCAGGGVSVLGPNPQEFFALFPFHFVMDRNFRLLQVGNGLKKVLPELAVPGVQVDDLLTILHPTVAWDSDMMDLILEERMISKMVLESFDGLLVLKGGLYKMRPLKQAAGADAEGGAVVHGREHVLVFLGSPNCSSFDSMAAHHLYLSDIPAHDMTSDYVLMADHRRAKIQDLEVTAETLLQERRCNSALKETLAEALAAQMDAVGEVSTDSAIDVTLKLLDSLLMREDVDMRHVLYVRDTLLHAGTNLWRPVDFDTRRIDKDQDVNAALGTLLGTSGGVVEHMDAGELRGLVESRTGSTLSMLSDNDCGGSGGGETDDSERSGGGAGAGPLLQGTPIKNKLFSDMLVTVQAPCGAAKVDPHSSRGIIRLLLEPTTELTSALRDVDAWQFDVFALNRASNGHALSCLAYHLMKKMDIIKTLHLNEKKLIRYLLRIEQGYPDHPYHSRVHAADVLRTLHVLLTRVGVLDTVVSTGKLELTGHVSTTANDALAGLDQHENVLASYPFKLLTCYLAAVIHDYEHKGVNNEFLIRSKDVLALRYNDLSPMENHHAAAALSLLYERNHSFIPHVDERMQDTLRKGVIDLVLSTDMKQHFALVGVFNSKVAQERPDRDSSRCSSGHSAGRFSGGSSAKKLAFSRAKSLNFTTYTAGTTDQQLTAVPSWDADTRLLVLKMALKFADVGHLSSSMDVHKEWVFLLEEEMFLQGDQEKALGHPISPLMDRSKAGVSKAQCSFYSVVAIPMFQSFARVFPAAEGLISNVMSNYNYWRELEGNK